MTSSRALLGRWWACAALGLCTQAVGQDGGPSVRGRTDLESIRLPAEAEVAARFSQVTAALQRTERGEPWRPRVNDERPRGAALDVYAKVAPATVVILAGDSSRGTGLIVDPTGWIVTNHHVVEDAPLDPGTGVRTVRVYLGRLRDGVMTLIEEPLTALVYKTNPEKDLALLRLTSLPADVDRLPVISLAKQPPSPGSDCVVIGHPKAGMLWTVRGGQVASLGQWPSEMIDQVFQRLTAAGKDRDRLSELLKSAPQRKVLISTCGLNPGDSGGPLVNGGGELIGVAFAVPRSREGSSVSLDKFSYYIHLDEVRSFLADRPQEPRVEVPDPWPPGVYGALADLDRDGVPDTLVFGLSKGEELTGILCDLDQDSDPKWSPSLLAVPSRRDGWDFEFAYQRGPQVRAFYDTDDDGKIDLVLTDGDGDGVADASLRLEGGSWTGATPGKGQRLFDPMLFEDRDQRERFVQIGSP